MGQGPPLVLLHAGVTDRRVWAAQVARLWAGHRVVTYDRRGYGETPAADEPYSDVTDLLAVLDAGDIRQAVLVGSSKGGEIALDFALASPGRVCALVLVGTAIGGMPVPDDWGEVPECLGGEMQEAREAGDLDRLNELEAQLWLDGANPPGRVQGPLRDLFLAMNGPVLRAAPEEGTPPERTAYPRLPELTVPTLLVVGSLELPHLRAASEHAARVMPRAELHVVPDTAHLPALERPGAFGDLLDRFLASLPGGSEA
ncbi:alpha/beta fold hydrolase [uncultured Deinococcus sp.]|uniref:alpha/beta fold hydrolase n=1 Tax=uncultured Deinococcus sp. TaxID=158789 RepID=UPI002586B16D|nr:alpha/beta fold hydrolase [uncultured Deinococcus sp.]